jgi:hypothetical protein
MLHYKVLGDICRIYQCIRDHKHLALWLSQYSHSRHLDILGQQMIVLDLPLLQPQPQ